MLVSMTCEFVCVCREEAVPAGSLRCDKLVKSSLASSMAGFINGGSLSSLPVWMASRVVSTVLVCTIHDQYPLPTGFAVHGCGCGSTSPFSRVKTSVTLSPAICLSVTSEATQPSVVSGCHARVPMS